MYILPFPSGAGEANFDSYENNPFQNPKQRQEQEVQTLLQKLSHEMIGLDSSFVGTLDKGKQFLLLNKRSNVSYSTRSPGSMIVISDRPCIN